jgi:hypothetical protein
MALCGETSVHANPIRDTELFYHKGLAKEAAKAEK